MKINMPVTENEHLLPDGVTMVATTDLKGIIVSVNANFIAVSGFSAAELIGSSLNLIRHPHMPPAIFDHLWHTIRSGKAWNGLVRNRRKNGDYYWVDAFIIPIECNGEIIGYQSVLTRPNKERVARTERLYDQMRNNVPVYGLAS